MSNSLRTKKSKTANKFYEKRAVDFKVATKVKITNPKNNYERVDQCTEMIINLADKAYGTDPIPGKYLHQKLKKAKNHLEDLMKALEAEARDSFHKNKYWDEV
tara:strand:- start:3412 stop:3720 length:309 start_codon:yes stop_codon:yes gene_type:complete